jgi:soluble P-type ATPase
MQRNIMMEIVIPGYRALQLQHLVMDYNGTLAQDGHLLEGVRPRLTSLAERLRLHVVTADTFGIVRSQLAGIPCELIVLPGEEQASAKLAYIRKLGEGHVAAIGNGRNDRLMLEAAALGIGLIQGEGAAVETCQAADLILLDILMALDLFLNPKRLIATMRS